jgi:hypothetical protein
MSEEPEKPFDAEFLRGIHELAIALLNRLGK